MPKVVAIIQARLGSSRLPEKVLLPLAGKPMLVRVVERVARAGLVDEVVIATTDETQDNRLAEFCEARGWPVYRGSEWDVLDRYYQTAVASEADIVVRITSDCPLIDPALIDAVVAKLQETPALDYVANVLPRRTYPRGLDVEAFPFATLERLWRVDENPAWREHVTAYLHKRPEEFAIGGVMGEEDHSDLRWTVDTQADYELVERIYADFGEAPFGIAELLAWMAEHPRWARHNAHIEQKKING